MKRQISIIFVVAIFLMMTVAPSYSVKSQSVTVKEFIEEVLKTMDIKAVDPIIAATDISLVLKSDNMLKHSSSPIKKEEAAQVIYGALRATEKVKYDKYYARVLNYYVTDSKNISTQYKAAVYMDIIAGIFEPQVISRSKKLFNPKNVVTTANMNLWLERLEDKNKRFNPFFVPGGGGSDVEHPDMVTWFQNKLGGEDVSGIIWKAPKLSDVKKTIKVDSNNNLIIDKNKVFRELKDQEYNKYCISLHKYYTYDEFINAPWYDGVFSEPTVDPERMDKIVMEEYDVAVKFMDSLYNVTFKDTASIRKRMLATMLDNEVNQKNIKSQIKDITERKLIIESRFISDKTMFYNGQNDLLSSDYIRGRLYFRYIDPNRKTSIFTIYKDTDGDDVSIKTNTWYYADFDVWVDSLYIPPTENSKEETRYFANFLHQISDLYELKTSK